MHAYGGPAGKLQLAAECTALHTCQQGWMPFAYQLCGGIISAVPAPKQVQHVYNMTTMRKSELLE